MIFVFSSQKPTNIDILTIDKSTDTEDLVVVEPTIVFAEENVKCEKPTRKIKRETKPRRRTKKAKKIEEGKSLI